LAITLATIGSHEQIVIELLQAGTMPDSESIIAAILVRNIKLLRLFLDIGVPLAERANGRGFLSLAVRWGNLDAVQLLIEAGASLHEMGLSIPFLQIDPRTHRPLFTPLGEAINRGDEKLIQLLFENGASASLERMATSGLMESPLCTAVKSRNESIVQMLLVRGAEPCDSLALLAASSQSTVMMQILLQAFHSQYPAGKKYYSSFALRAAIRNCDLVKLRLLARYTDLNDTEQKSGDMDVSENPYEENLPSPLGEAIATCNVEIIQIILDAGGNPNKTVTTRISYSHRGRWTALLAAVATEDLKIVELICNAGADVNYAAHLGTTRTPLQLAVETGSLDIVKFLLSRDADVNALPCIWGGGTALQLAAIKGYIGIAELLIQRGANINAPRGRYEGRTAFEGAAEHGRMDMLLLLYHEGVDLVSDGGEQVRRAMELAEENSQLGAKGLVEQLSLSPGATFMI
jgi:ankyrin repeat protein